MPPEVAAPEPVARGVISPSRPTSTWSSRPSNCKDRTPPYVRTGQAAVIPVRHQTRRSLRVLSRSVVEMSAKRATSTSSRPCRVRRQCTRRPICPRRCRRWSQPGRSPRWNWLRLARQRSRVPRPPDVVLRWDPYHQTRPDRYLECSVFPREGRQISQAQRTDAKSGGRPDARASDRQPAVYSVGRRGLAGSHPNVLACALGRRWLPAIGRPPRALRLGALTLTGVEEPVVSNLLPVSGAGLSVIEGHRTALSRCIQPYPKNSIQQEFVQKLVWDEK